MSRSYVELFDLRSGNVAANYADENEAWAALRQAAMEDGLLTPATVLNDPGVFRYGGREFKNAGDAVFGSLALPRALQVSSDVFFYQLGASLNEQGPVIQD